MPPSVDAALAALSPAARAAFASDYAARAFDLGLRYLAPEGARPIPVAFPPIVEPAARTAERAAVARATTAVLARVAVRLLDGAAGGALAEALFAELAPFERAIVERRYRSIDKLATVRVDLFVDPDGVDRVLEINATIPAMQGYSDIAAQAFVETVLERLGHGGDAAAILAANGSNARDLLASLVACYRADGGTEALPSIALLHRPGDSQLGELEYLAASFRAAGHDARTVLSTAVTLEGGRAVTGPFAPAILYRHVFASRLDPALPLATIFAAPEGHHLYNPVDPHLEQKSLLAELSAASVDEARAALLGLHPAEAALVRRHVPWTRRLAGGPTTGPAGEPIADPVAWCVAQRDRLVIKRSWDFGGKGVFLGAEYGDEASLQRARDRFGEARSWEALIEACVAEGGWVIQERVPLRRRQLSIASREGAALRELFVDVSAYTNVGVAPAPTGGVCRASGSPIVNIQSGGGVVPLLSAEATARLAAQLR
ncbi:hypothetical protein [Vulgatibacter sp.]|uniref:hypothetical protein n=1 Tax=Vulgatibacter sp. TaxID=1971226 RepID=UPI00356603CB